MRAILCTFVWSLAGIAVVSAGPRADTRVVVLDNDNLLQGVVVRTEDGYEVRQANGSSVTIPAHRVVAVVADLKAAFSAVADRANRGDADERLRLARWCAANGLPAEALAEARTAARMRPGFAAAERYVALLQETARNPTPQADPAVVQAKAEVIKPNAVTEIPAINYNSESFPLFATRINAILVNTCANCHARPDAKSLRLTRVGGRSGVTRNMLAALQYVDPKQPEKSAILAKAIAAHGTATEPPFKTRTHPAYQALEMSARVARAPRKERARRRTRRRQSRNCSPRSNPQRARRRRKKARVQATRLVRTASPFRARRSRSVQPIHLTRRSSTARSRTNDGASNHFRAYGRHLAAIARPQRIDRVRHPDRSAPSSSSAGRLASGSRRCP